MPPVFRYLLPYRQFQILQSGHGTDIATGDGICLGLSQSFKQKDLFDPAFNDGTIPLHKTYRLACRQCTSVYPADSNPSYIIG